MILRGDKTWPFSVRFIGAFEVLDVFATWFGGDDDPEDEGETASGYPTKGHPNLLGCSLPMEFCNVVPSTRGAPFPRMPWGITSNGTDNPDGCHVMVWPMVDPAETLVVPLIDIGPAKSASKATRKGLQHSQYLRRAAFVKEQAAWQGRAHAIDLTQAAFKKLGGNLNTGLMRVGFKVLG